MFLLSQKKQCFLSTIPVASVGLFAIAGMSDKAIALTPLQYSIATDTIKIEPTYFKSFYPSYLNCSQYLNHSCNNSFFHLNSNDSVVNNELDFSFSLGVSLSQDTSDNFFPLIDATQPPVSLNTEEESTQDNLPVKQIEINGSTVLQPEIVATLNSKVFPNVENARIVCPDKSESEQTEKPSCSIMARVKSTGIALANLLAIRSAITQLYIEHDYVTSGAFLPTNQVLEDTVSIEVLEGELETVEIKGLKRLDESYIHSRLRSASNEPLDRQSLLEALQLLQLDSHIERINAELVAGNSPASSILLLDVQENNAFSFGVSAANNRSPSIGSTQGSVFVTHNNLSGFGDRLTAEYGASEGLDIYGVGYTLPINGMDGTLSFRYSNNGSTIIEDDFARLDINSDSESFAFGFRQPIIRKPQTELALGLNLDLRRSQTFIQDEPFSFGAGSQEGKSNVTALRLVQEWSNRQSQTVIAARSELSFGLDAFNATINDNGVDGRFFAWRGQFQYARQFDNDFVLLAGISTQLTPDSLLSLEQISIGGSDTIRGYRSNQSVADNGVVSSLELRIPLVSNSWNQLQLTPFFELGTVWNSDFPNPESATLASIGTGLRWQIGSNFNFNLSYGLPLIEVEENGDSLQENGINFSLRYQP